LAQSRRVIDSKAEGGRGGERERELALELAPESDYEMVY
jgi:hypothetical protein